LARSLASPTSFYLLLIKKGKPDETANLNEVIGAEAE